MLYAALTFWLLVAVFVAYGIYQLWAGIIKPKTINLLILPGTLVAQIGHIIGKLITGGTVTNAKLIKEDDPEKPPPADKEEIPVLGPIVVALLPILACGFSIYVVISTIGQEVMVEAEMQKVSETIPLTAGAFWQLLRDSLTVVEQAMSMIFSSDFSNWETWLFVYLLICLTVRLAPLPGSQRGAVGAIVVVGLATAIISMATQTTAESMQNMWHALSIAIAILLFLMIVSLMIRGGVGFFRILTNQA